MEVTNRFKGLDLIDRVPKELSMEVHDIVQEAVIKTIPKKKKCKKAQWLSEEVLQIAEKRTKAKGKGEKGGRTHLNAEFQTIARRDKKAFLYEHCKEIEENNRIGKTRDLFKKARNTVGGVCNFLGSVSSQQKFEARDKPTLQPLDDQCYSSRMDQCRSSVFQLNFI